MNARTDFKNALQKLTTTLVKAEAAKEHGDDAAFAALKLTGLEQWKRVLATRATIVAEAAAAPAAEAEATPGDEAKGALAGIFVFDVPTIEEARALAGDDPAVKAGRLTVEVVPWYGPVGLTYDGHEIGAAKPR